LIFVFATGSLDVGEQNRWGFHMKALRYFIIATSTLAFNAAAFAATVTSIEGPLQVNTGSGFHRVSRTAQVAPGGSVMVGPGGKAEILYSDGCRIPVTPGAVAVVAPVSPCAQGQAYGYDSSPWLGYGLAVGAGIGIGAAIWSNRGNNNNPVVVVVSQPASP
jgi:hypothetical protein